MGVAYSLLDRGTIPDVALRPIIRSLCRERLGKITRGTTQERHERKMEYIRNLKAREVIADKTAEANEQHYEVSRTTDELTPPPPPALGPISPAHPDRELPQR